MSNPNNIVVIYGSPRKKGNSRALALEVIKGIKTTGATFCDFYLHGMQIKPCSACDKCQDDINKLCATKDRMHEIYPALIQCKTIILASPVYCFTFSAQIKLFMDRCYALWGPDDHLLKGKNIVAILTYGADDILSAGGINAIRTYQDAYKFYECKFEDVLHCKAHKIGDVNKNQAIMNKAFNLGIKIGNYSKCKK